MRIKKEIDEYNPPYNMKNLNSLLTHSGFDKEYERCLKIFSSEKDAYEAVEHLIYFWFKVRKFSSFKSYMAYRNKTTESSER